MKQETKQTLMSSEKQDWGTPQALFDQLNLIFDFNLDACAHKDNFKYPVYITEDQNSLKTSWALFVGSHVKAWLNPPYGRALPVWLDKVRQEVEGGSMVCVLVPARVETNWFDVIWDHADHILFFNKRIVFEGGKSGAPFPSALGIFNRGLSKAEKKELSVLGRVVDL